MKHAVAALLLVLAACAASRPETAGGWRDLAQDYERAKDWARAAEAWSQALLLEPQYREHFYNRGLARHEAGDFNGAIADFDYVLQALVNDGRVHVSRARSKAAKGDTAAALEDCLTAVTEYPGTPQADALFEKLAGMKPAAWQGQRGDALRAQGDLDGAYRAYRAGQRLAKTPALQQALFTLSEGYAKRGDALRAKGELVLARVAYTTALFVRYPEDGTVRGKIVMGSADDLPAAREGYETVNPAAENAGSTLATEPWRSGTFDGRTVEVRIERKFKESHINLFGTHTIVRGKEDVDVHNTDHFKLVEGATELIPINWHRIEIVPGDGVYVLTSSERLRYLGDVHQRLAVGAPATRWRRFDLKTRLSMPSDVVHIQHYGNALLVVRRAADGGLTAEAGGVRYEAFRPEVDQRDGAPSVLRAAGPISLLRSGERTVVLGPSLEPLKGVDREITTLTMGKARYFGALVGDDLWRFVDSQGAISAPGGVDGFRPFGHPTGRRWLVRFFLPGEPGYVEVKDLKPRRWGLAEGDLSKMSVPLWDHAELLPPAGLGRKDDYTNGYGESARMPRSFYDHPILVTVVDGAWIASTVADPALPGIQAGAEGKTREEAVESLTKKAKDAIAADLEAVAELVKTQKADAEDRKAKFEAYWRSLNQVQKETWLLKNGGDPARWDVVAATSNSLHYLSLIWYRKLGTSGKRLEIFNRWYGLMKASTTPWLLAREAEMLEFHADIDFTIPDQKAKARELRKLAFERSPEGMAAKDKEKADQEAARESARAAAEMAAFEAERRRQEVRGWLNPRGGLSSPSWTLPPNPSQPRYDEDAYKRNLDRVLNGKAWTPYGY